ncbi:hypothetical protein MHYP_G00051090 [Metynnis hypsauchen]
MLVRFFEVETRWNVEPHFKLDTAFRASWGSVTVLGTPAEEEGGGKIDLLREGAFEDVDVVLMAHPSQEDCTYIPDVAEHE